MEFGDVAPAPQIHGGYVCQLRRGKEDNGKEHCTPSVTLTPRTFLRLALSRAARGIRGYESDRSVIDRFGFACLECWSSRPDQIVGQVLDSCVYTCM